MSAAGDPRKTRVVALCGGIGVEGAHSATAIIAWFTADVIQREQPVVAVECGVLDPLGGNRRRDLLEFHGERTVRAQLRVARGRQLQQQCRTHEVEYRRFARGPAPAARIASWGRACNWA